MTFARWTSLLVASAVAVLSGCTSDGQVGGKGIVRFSQVVHFADTEDFSAPLARNRTLLVALQDPQTVLGFDGSTLEDVTMEVRRDGSKVESAWPLGFAQFAVNLPDDGTYQLVAVRDGQDLDSISVTVEEQKQIRWSKKARLVTTHSDPSPGGKSCSRTDELESFEDLVLHQNQTLMVYVVAESAKPEAMLGLLPLTAHVPDELSADVPLVGHGAMANSLVLSPVKTLGESLEITVRDEETKQELPLKLRASSDKVTLDCP